MTSEKIIQELERYRSELTGIMGRFVRRPNSYRINREDDPIYRTFIIEIIDLLNDSMGDNKYSKMISNTYQQGIFNEFQIPSYKSIEDIVSIINSVITRLERNPDFYVKKEEPEKPNNQEKPELKPPGKVTLKWIWEHTPSSYYWTALVFLFAIFCLGIAFAKTNLYKSLMDEATANTSTNKNAPPTSPPTSR